MKSISEMIDHIIETEGGYINHTADKGGATKYGITLKTYAKWTGKPKTIEDIMLLTKRTARSIYTLTYYNAPKICKLHTYIQHQVLDCSVNHGPVRAVKLLQKTINKITDTKLVVDGKIGTMTIKACTSAILQHGVDLNNSLVKQRVKFYKRIVHKNPTQRVFLKGWLARARSFTLVRSTYSKLC